MQGYVILRSGRESVQAALKGDLAADTLKKTVGAVAQLGARQNGILEVTGSIPVGSTEKACDQRRKLFCFSGLGQTLPSLSSRIRHFCLIPCLISIIRCLIRPR
jgi:hypothetical protein